MNKRCVDPIRLNEGLERVPEHVRERVKCAARSRSRAGSRAALMLVLTLALPAFGQQSQVDLTKESLENLMNMEVTSVSKREQKLSRTASAIFVITAEDIRQSGATNIPDLLRMVPGVQVAQMDSNTWAITVRGFNGEYADDLLVLIDGRTVYSPVFAGVFWNVQNVPLENIERIEVIRGPGATVWGANAVNGVINIITKKSADTQGGLVSGGAGTYEQGFGTIRYGGTLGKNTTYRANVSGFNRDHLPSLSGQNNGDSWHALAAGFRIDSKIGDNNSLLFEGDSFTGSANELASIVSLSSLPNATVPVLDRFSGWDVISRWDHTISPTSQTTLQVYLDRNNRGDTTYEIGLVTLDVDFQHHFAWGDRQDLVWGLGYRMTTDEIGHNVRVAMNPPALTMQLFSSFVQDEVAIRPNSLYLTAGTKLEHNPFSSFAWEPSVRADWLINEKSSAWVAVSRAISTPSQAGRDVRINYAVLSQQTGIPLMLSAIGSPNFRNIELTSVEAGYRAQLNSRLSIDGTSFFNHYDDAESLEPGTPFLESSPAPHIVVPVYFANLLYAETHGAEIFADWKPNSRWTLSPGYAYLSVHAHTHSGSLDTVSGPGLEGGSPNHQIDLRSSVRLGRGFQWNTSAYFVGRLPSQQVPSYTRLDTNLIWQAGERFSIALVGQNLLKDHHIEFNSLESTHLAGRVKRSAYIKLSWKF